MDSRGTARKEALDHILAQRDSNDSEDFGAGFILPSYNELAEHGQILKEDHDPDQVDDGSPTSILTNDRISRFSLLRDCEEDVVMGLSRSMPSWVDNLRVKWKDEIKFNMNGDLQDWFMKQQLEILEQRTEYGDEEDEGKGRIRRRGEEDDESYFSLSLDSNEDKLPQEEEDEEEGEEERSKRSKGLLSKILSRPRSQGSIYRQFTRKSKPVVEKYKRYLYKLSTEINQTKQNFDADLKNIPDWAPPKLASICRNYYHNRLLWLENKQKVQVYRIKALRDAQEDIERILRGELVQNESTRHLSDPRKMSLSSDMEILENSCREMESVLEILKKEFSKIKKKSARKLSKEHRSKLLKDILERCAESSVEDSNLNVYFHPLVTHDQQEFNRFMLDDRYREGKAFSKWIELTLKTYERGFTSQALNQSRKAIVRIIFSNNEIEPSERMIRPLLLCLDRLIFPRLSEIWIPLVNITFGHDKIVRFHKQVRQLRKLDQNTFGISRKFQLKDQESDEFPYQKSISILSRMNSECSMVPTDIIGIVVICVDSVVEEARLYNDSDVFEFGADDLVPILEWIIVHCRTSHVFETILHALYIFDINTGRGAFCLAQFQSAVYGILDKQLASQ